MDKDKVIVMDAGDATNYLDLVRELTERGIISAASDVCNIAQYFVAIRTDSGYTEGDYLCAVLRFAEMTPDSLIPSNIRWVVVRDDWEYTYHVSVGEMFRKLIELANDTIVRVHSYDASRTLEPNKFRLNSTFTHDLQTYQI